MDIEDVVSAHLLAIEKVLAIGFARYLISGTTPFTHDDLFDLRADAPSVLRRRVPDYEAIYAHLGWKMCPTTDRVYVNERARHELGWQPRYSFTSILERLKPNADPFSALTRVIGSKGYHMIKFAESP